MGLGLAEARKAAEHLIEEWSPYVLDGIWQTPNLWVFRLADQSGEVVYMNLPDIVVDKKTGEAREVYLPSDEGFAILKEGRPIEEGA